MEDRPFPMKKKFDFTTPFNFKSESSHYSRSWGAFYLRLKHGTNLLLSRESAQGIEILTHHFLWLHPFSQASAIPAPPSLSNPTPNFHRWASSACTFQWVVCNPSSGQNGPKLRTCWWNFHGQWILLRWRSLLATHVPRTSVNMIPITVFLWYTLFVPAIFLDDSSASLLEW